MAWITFNPVQPTVPQVEHSILAKIAEKFGQKWVKADIIIKQLVSRHNVNRTKKSYRRIAGRHLYRFKYGSHFEGWRRV